MMQSSFWRPSKNTIRYKFEKFERVGLQIELKKSKFFTKEVHFCRARDEPAGLRSRNTKGSAIMKMTPPTN